jgi:hypothetical protein
MYAILAILVALSASEGAIIAKLIAFTAIYAIPAILIALSANSSAR